MPQTSSCAALPAEHYTVLRSLAAKGAIVSRRPEATELGLQQCGLLQQVKPTATSDLILLAEARQETQGALLCLRCRVTWPLEHHINGHFHQFKETYGVELSALAAFALDDRGQDVPISLDPQPAEHRVPFTVTVIRSFDPDQKAGLPHWARMCLDGRNDYKDYLKEHGVLLIREWALLGDCSHKQVREAMEKAGVATALTPKAAEALHRHYLPAYKKAKLSHKRLTGRQKGWQPDAAFFLEVDPQRPCSETEADLLTIQTAVRWFLSGRWQRDERRLVSIDGIERSEGQLADPCPGPLEHLMEAEQGVAVTNPAKVVMEKAGSSYVQQLLAELPPGDEQWCFWQGWLEGRSTREIAERCGAAQARVSRRLRVRERAGEIATEALQRLKPLPQFAEVFASPEQLDAAAGRLVNHLLQPEQEGEDPPLRRWLRVAISQDLHATNTAAPENEGGSP